MSKEKKRMIWLGACPFGGAIVWGVLFLLLPHENMTLLNVAGASLTILTMLAAFIAQMRIGKGK